MIGIVSKVNGHKGVNHVWGPSVGWSRFRALSPVATKYPLSGGGKQVLQSIL